MTATFVRALMPEDVPAISAPTTQVAPAASPIARIKHAHHSLARRIALGESPGVISAATGYSPGYIATIQRDPAFQELLSYYTTQAEQIFIDVAERMRDLGIASLEELQNRLDENPEEWSRRELMELAELMLVKPMAAAGKFGQNGGNGAGGGVAISVKFVNAPAGADRPVIDGEIIPPENESD
jgi:hypothetical protein